jgi:hypothetical protein
MKATVTSLLVLSGLAGPAFTAQAQATISFGPRLGLNVSTFSYDYGDTPTGLSNETNYVAGVQVGGTVNVDFGNFAFQPSLIFSQKGAELVGSASDDSNGYTSSYKASVKTTLNVLEIPLNFVYTTGGDHGFQVFAGPYVAMGVGGSGSGKVTIASDDPDVVFSGAVGSFPIDVNVEYGDKESDNSGNSNPTGNLQATATFRRFDAGFNAGIGYRVGPFQAQAGYGFGLVNMVPKDSDGNDTGSTAHHRVFQLTGTYFFGSK